MEIVDEPGGDERSESDGYALAVIHQCRRGGLAGKLLLLRVVFILCLCAQEQGLRAAGGDVPIRLVMYVFQPESAFEENR